MGVFDSSKGPGATPTTSLGGNKATATGTGTKSKPEGALPSSRIYGTFESESTSSGILTPRKFSHYSDFERKREDGTFVIDLVPEVRVFTCGGEITKDVLSVDIDYTISGGSTCNIRLANPKGKYELSRQDLMGFWREDKDINAAYNAEWLQRQQTPNPSLLNVGKNFLGSDITTLASTVVDHFTKEDLYISNITRMIFETKFYSGITKQIGDTVFCYRDPVYVFMKGRYSSFWYFAFTGMVTKFDSNDIYGNLQEITLSCSDLLYMLQKKKVTQKGSLIMSGNLESSIVDQDRSMDKSLFDDLLGTGTADKIVKRIIYGSDNYLKVENCFPVAILSKNNYAFGSSTDFIVEYKEFLKSRDKLCLKNSPGYMFTYDDSGLQDTGASFTDVKKFFTKDNLSNVANKLLKGGSLPNYTFEASKLSEMSHPNDGQFSPQLPLYFQYNEIKPSQFNGEAVKNAYNSTVRYWEKDLFIDVSVKSGTASSWKSKNFFGVAGTHPALQYEFINNFNVLPNIWSFVQYNKSVMDTLECSMYDKLLETVGGSFKEKKGVTGNNVNHFRPRFFLLLPKKWQDKVPGKSGFGEFLLTKTDATNALDMLTKLASKMEFNIYSSPMGDIFMEPSMHDLHPLEFWENIEDRSILMKDDGPTFNDKGIPVYFKQTLHDSLSSPICKRKDHAYFFNSDANHPFFFMEKDRKRITTSFNPENVYTSVSVIGSVLRKASDGRILSAVNDEELIQNLTIMNFSEQKSHTSNSFTGGLYIADGFSNSVRSNNRSFDTDKNKCLLLIQSYKEILNKIVLNNIISKYSKYTIGALIDEATLSITNISSAYSEKNITPIEKWSQGTSVIQKIFTTKPENLSKKTGKSNFTLKENIILEDLANRLYEDIKFQITTFSGSMQLDGTMSEWRGTTLAKTLIETYIPNFNKAKSLTDTTTPDENIRKSIESSIEYQQIYNLLLPILIDKNIEVAQQNMLLYKEEQLKNNIEGFSFIKPGVPTTLADYKIWAKQGLYNPRDDMMRRFGFNPKTPYVNYYINNGNEANQFARTYFNILFGKAYVNKISFIGRPEVFLNRPYFLEKKDCIGLLSTYKLQFSVGQPFVLDGELTYIRKNALTFAFSNDELDSLYAVESKDPATDSSTDLFNKLGFKFSITSAATKTAGKSTLLEGGRKSNTYFYNLAAKYYSDTFGAGLSKFLDNTIGDAGTSLVGKAFKDKKLDVWNAGKPVGGLYTAHDWVGHMDYEEDGKAICDRTTTSFYKFLCQEVVNPDQINSILEVCRLIKQKLEMLRVYEDKLDICSSELKTLEEESTSLNKKKEDAKKTGNSTEIKSIQDRIQNVEREINFKKDEKYLWLSEHRVIGQSIYGADIYSIGEESYDVMSKETDWKLKRNPKVSVVSEGSKFTDPYSLYGRFKNLLESLYDKTSTKKPQYMDDRADASTLESWGAEKMTTPIYINKIECSPEKKKEEVDDAKYLFLYINFGYNDDDYSPTLSTVYIYPHTAWNGTEQKAINTTNAQEIDKAIVYLTQLIDKIDFIEIIGHCSKQWQVNKGKSIMSYGQSFVDAMAIEQKALSKRRAESFKDILIKELNIRIKTVSDPSTLNKVLTLVTKARSGGMSFSRGYFDNKWLQEKYKDKAGGRKGDAIADYARRTRNIGEGINVGEIDQRAEIRISYKKGSK